jgi:transcriptional regulator with XRE-family HTH domain
MITDKERQIRESLTDKEYRDALAVEHVNTALAVQIRKIREHCKLTQKDLAEKLGKHQESVSQWENPDYGRYSITTLKELASTFDVALLVKFISFSELVKDMTNLDETRLSPPSFREEQLLFTVNISQFVQKNDIVPLDANNTLYSPIIHWVNNNRSDIALGYGLKREEKTAEKQKISEERILINA